MCYFFIDVGNRGSDNCFYKEIENNFFVCYNWGFCFVSCFVIYYSNCYCFIDSQICCMNGFLIYCLGNVDFYCLNNFYSYLLSE